MTLQKWIDESKLILNRDFGLDIEFGAKVALFFLYLHQYGLKPTITSGFRSPEKQKELLDRWNAGDPGIVVKPAAISKHSNMVFNKPAALAVDIKTNNPALAAQIAKQLGIGTGYDFTTPDPVHFYV